MTRGRRPHQSAPEPAPDSAHCPSPVAQSTPAPALVGKHDAATAGVTAHGPSRYWCGAGHATSPSPQRHAAPHKDNICPDRHMLKVPAQGQCQSAPASAHAPQKSMYPPPHINACR